MAIDLNFFYVMSQVNNLMFVNWTPSVNFM